MPIKELEKINYNGDEYLLVDSTASSKYAQISHTHLMDQIADGVQGVYYVKGTQSESTASWTGNLLTVDALYDGLTIVYYLPYAGTSTSATLTLTLKNNVQTAAEPVYYTSTTRATTHFGVSSVILLTWVSNTSTGLSAVGSATGRWLRADYDANNNTVPAAHCTTAAGTAAKTASHTYYTAKANSYELITMRYSNTKAAALTLNINSVGPKPIYINGAPSSATNYTLPAGTYLIFYDGTNYYFNTTGDIPNLKENLGIPNDWSWDKTKVEISNLTASGNKVADITIDGTSDTLYAPAYSGTSPISVSGTSISHSNSGVSANTYGVTATTQLSPAFGTSFSVPGFTVNATGHVTAAGAHNVQLPSISVTQNLTSGTKVGTINIGGTTTDLYAPSNTNTWDAYGGATANAAGTAGYIPGAAANQLFQYFAGNGTWRGAPTASGELGLITYEEKTKLAAIADGADNVSYTGSTTVSALTSKIELGKITINGTDNSIYAPKMVVLSYGTSTWAEAEEAYKNNLVIYCKASLNANPASGNQSRMAFLAYVNNPTTPTEFEFQYYRSVATHSDSQQGDQVFVYKLNKTSGWSVTTREAYTKVANGTGIQKSYSNRTITLSLDTHSHSVDDITDLVFDGTYNSSSNKAATISTVTTAVSGITPESLGLSKALKFIGFSTTAISDGQTTAPTISGLNSYTPAAGDVVIDGHDATADSQWEYVYTTANKWERLGGDASYVIGGTEYDVTNGGENSSSSVTITPSTTDVYSMTSAGSVTPGNEASLTMSVTNEKLTFNFDANTPTLVTLPGRSSVIKAWTGYTAATAAAQIFTPTTKTIQVN